MTAIKGQKPDERSRDPDLLAWYRFVRVMKKIIQGLNELMRDMDLSQSQFDLLMQVAFEKGISQQACADGMNVTKGNVTQHLDRLEEQDLVRRQKVGRTNHLYLTDSGQTLVDEIMPIHDAYVKGILSLMTDQEFSQFQRILRRLDRGLG